MFIMARAFFSEEVLRLLKLSCFNVFPNLLYISAFTTMHRLSFSCKERDRGRNKQLYPHRRPLLCIPRLQ